MSTIGIGVDETSRDSSPSDANLRANKLTLGASVPFAPGWSGSNDVPTQDALYNQFTTGAGVVTISVLTANATTTLATPVETGLEVALLPNSKYTVILALGIGCNNTGGLTIGMTGAGTGKRILGIGNTATTTFVRWVTSSDAMISTALNTINSTTGALHALGTVITSASPETLRVQFQAVVAGQTATVFSNGTFLQVTKIG